MLIYIPFKSEFVPSNLLYKLFCIQAYFIIYWPSKFKYKYLLFSTSNAIYNKNVLYIVCET